MMAHRRVGREKDHEETPLRHETLDSQIMMTRRPDEPEESQADNG